MALILVVEDEPDLIQLLRDQLTALGHQVALARDGEEGVALAVERHPDLVLTDVIMPYMDGPEMLRKLRENPQTHDIPVIALTARTDRPTQARLAALGVVGYLAKPYSMRDLAAQVERAAASRSRIG